MAYLPAEPFTVIGEELSHSDTKDSINNHDNKYVNEQEEEEEEESSFVPPSSTWYDESHQHFVALLDRSFMIGTTTVDSNEVRKRIIIFFVFVL